MRTAFCGMGHQVGTSANMAAVAAGMEIFCRIPVKITETVNEFAAESSGMVFLDCSHLSQEEIRRTISVCDFLILNFSVAEQKPEEDNLKYFNYFTVPKNVIFLIGKYFQQSQKNPEQMAHLYRMPKSSVCTLPYHMRFQTAYEHNRTGQFVRHVMQPEGTYENQLFQSSLLGIIQKILNYGQGEIKYG